ncbi:MAG: hypothetical protein H0W39_07480 [Sphingomonas sp.]|nr:hypothetical protein [Sphingomonas sp.]
MRIRVWAFVGACVLAGGAAHAQSVADLRAQYQQTQAMINDAESQGVDPGLVASLRESLNGLKQVIDEMEQEQASNSSSSDETPVVEAVPALQPAEGNLASGTCSRFGMDEENYRQTALADGNDQQIRALCGQAYEYYSMYKRALSQRHPEAWKTYDAHKKSAMVVNNFYGEARALPNEGLREDTRTAADQVAAAKAQQAAAARSVPKPPPAPPCRGCVTPQ